MRNEERLGTSPQETNRSTNSTSPPNQIQNLLSFPTSTEFVDLPSEGNFYPSDHRLHGATQIEMKVMTTKEEDILLNTNYIKNGIVIDKLLKSLIVDKSIRLEDLLIGDKNALVFAARASGLGHLYTAKVTCSNCAESTSIEHDLSDLSTKQARDVDWIASTDAGTFMVTLPKSKLKVEFKLLTGRGEKDIEVTISKRKKHRLPVNHLLLRLQKIIVSINEISDPLQISKCLEAMPIMDSRRIRLAYDHVLPDIDTSLEFVCPFCDTEQEVGLPLTADFFWADS
jgi:hypothetical protein